MDTIKGLKRTNYCGDLRIEDVGKEVTLFGWNLSWFPASFRL